MPCDRYHHTAHKPHSPRIHYRHHPNCGQSVDVIRCLRRQHDETFIVKVDEETRLAVPGWMLDPIVCDGLREADRPEIAVDALLGLRALLDVQPLPKGQHPGSSGSSLTSGDGNEPPKAHPSATASKATARKRGTVGSTASRRTRSLSRTHRTAADGSGTKPGRGRSR